MVDDELDNTPTAERRRHDPIEHGVETVTYDQDNRPVRSLADRAITTIERMLKHGTITDEMADAAERFRTDFRIAMLEPLRAAQMRERTQSVPMPPELSYRAQRARQRISEAIGAVGQPGGSCLWAVIGEERSLKEWALIEKVYDERASGILVASLGTLRAHYKL